MKLLDDAKVKFEFTRVPGQSRVYKQTLKVVMLAALLFPLAAFANAMQVPSSQMVIPEYSPTASAVISSNPSQAKPIGVGTIASGGDALSLSVQLEAFSGPVDIYFGLYAPALDATNIYMLKEDGSLQTLAQGLVPWKSVQSGAFSENLFGNIPVSALPAGTYTFYLVVTPAGNLDGFYLWSTSIATGGGISQSSLAGNWYMNIGSAYTPFWARGPVSIDTSGNMSLTVTDWLGNKQQDSGTVTMNDGIITNSGNPTWQGAMDSGGTVAAGTETGDNQAKMFLMTKNQDTSYSTSDMNGTWEFYNYSADPSGPWWSRGTWTINNGAWSANASGWDGTSVEATGTVSITATGIMSISYPAGGPANDQCSMDSGKTVVVCTHTDNSSNPPATGIAVLVKMPSTNITLADLAGTWQMQQIEYQGPEWSRGSITLDSTGTFTAYSRTNSYGDHFTTLPAGALTISGTDIITYPASYYGMTTQCSMDADKTVMVCTEGGPSYGDADITIFLKQ